MVRHEVQLGWKGGVNKRSVTELAVSFMISMLRLVPQCNRDIRDGIWKNRKGAYLSGRTVGIIGCGHIGKDLTGVLNAFGCRVLANDIRDFPEFYANSGAQPVTLEHLLQHADVVTLHLPLDDTTRGIISAERLALMKPEAILINTARGGIVVESDLADALRAGELGGAGVDTLTVEPPPVDHPLLQPDIPNLIVTPHNAWASKKARQACVDQLTRVIGAFNRGQYLNRVV